MKTPASPTLISSSAGSTCVAYDDVWLIWVSQSMPTTAIDQARDHQRFRPEPRHQLGHDAGRDDDADAERQEREAGLQRAVAQVDLEVVGQEQEHREQPGPDQQEDQVGPAAVAVEHDPQRQQRVLGPASPRPRSRPAARPRRTRKKIVVEWPPAQHRGVVGVARVLGLGRLGEAVDERDQAERWPSARRGCRSACRRAPCSRAPAGSRRPATISATGTLTPRHQRHEAYSVRTPPMIRPMAAPPPASAPKTPNALARSLGSVNVTVTMRQRRRGHQRGERALQRRGRRTAAPGSRRCRPAPRRRRSRAGR